MSAVMTAVRELPRAWLARARQLAGEGRARRRRSSRPRRRGRGRGWGRGTRRGTRPWRRRRRSRTRGPDRGQGRGCGWPWWPGRTGPPSGPGVVRPRASRGRMRGPAGAGLDSSRAGCFSVTRGRCRVAGAWQRDAVAGGARPGVADRTPSAAGQPQKKRAPACGGALKEDGERLTRPFKRYRRSEPPKCLTSVFTLPSSCGDRRGTSSVTPDARAPPR